MATTLASIGTPAISELENLFQQVAPQQLEAGKFYIQKEEGNIMTILEVIENDENTQQLTVKGYMIRNEGGAWIPLTEEFHETGNVVIPYNEVEGTYYGPREGDVNMIRADATPMNVNVNKNKPIMGGRSRKNTRRNRKASRKNRKASRRNRK